MTFRQAVLAPSGPDADAIASMAWLLFGGGAAVLLLVTALFAVAVLAPAEGRRWLASESAVVVGGLVFPVVMLSALLGYAVAGLRAPDDGPPALTIAVVGEQWWWRVHYLDADGGIAAATANEIHVPVGRPVELRLSTADVIHSFWVPELAGKLDMIPGRVNRLRLQADRAGVFRGQCAEYCGGAHAFMAFHVVAEPPAVFAAWLARQATSAAVPRDDDLRLGHDVFLAAGCPACHTVRGVATAAAIGPDLTHMGGRRFVAAGMLPSSPETLARWIASSRHLKPASRMPPFAALDAAELGALSRWLASLE